MKKVVLMAILMILAIQVLCAQQLWPEPVNVVNSTFYDYNSSYSGKSELTDSQGNTYVFIKEYRPDGSETRLYKFSPTWQETWLEPLNINIIEPLDMIETSDGDLIFSVFEAHSDYSAVTLHKITPEGIRLWPESGIIIPGTTIGSERCAIAPDESGGAYLVYSHGFNYSWGEWRYQRINASGILSPSQAILLKEFEDNPGSPQIKTLPGNKVVVSVFSFTEASVICLGDQNQILWRKDHSGRSKIITTSEGTTYAAFSEANSLLVYKYDQNGTNLWTEPLSLDAGPWSAYTEIELSPDQSSIYLYWVYDNSGDRLAKISQNQELIWIRQSPFMDTETISLVPDALGGLFLYGYYYQSSIGRLWAHHLNSLGQETTQSMVEIPIVGYQDQPRFSGKLCGEELRLIYGYNQDVDRGIKAQKISSTGELGYGQTGLDLIAGLEVITAYHTLGKIGDKAIVVWGQRIPNGDKFQLQYQIYNSDGSPQFNNPILLTTSTRYIVKVNIYENIGVVA